MTLAVLLVPLYDPDHEHWEPLDGYTLRGYEWEKPYTAILGGTFVLTLGGFNFGVDLLDRSAVAPVVMPPPPAHTSGQNALVLLRDNSAHQLARGLADINLVPGAWGPSPSNPYFTSAWMLNEGLIDVADSTIIAPAGSAFEVTVIAGNPESAVLRVDRDHYYVRGASPWVVRLNSSLGPSLARTLFTAGLEALLSLSTQMPFDPQQQKRALMKERAPSFNLVGPPPVGPYVDYSGAAGPYYNEIFAHIAWRIADACRSEGKHESAYSWFRFIYDPSGENDPPANPPARRVWQFARYRTEDYQTLRDYLDNPAQLEAYRRDPFNPFVIGRLRPGTQEKAVLMQSVGNVLEWADSLFMEFTSESIDEAAMLYRLASDMLGPRPVNVGSCTDLKSNKPVTYAALAPQLRAGHEFVLELENLWAVPAHPDLTDLVQGATRIASASNPALVMAGALAGPAANDNALSRPLGWQSAQPAMWQMSKATPLSTLKLGMRMGDGTRSPTVGPPAGGSLGVSPDPFGPPGTEPWVGGDLMPGGRVAPAGVVVDPGDWTKPLSNGRPTPNAQPWQMLDTALAFCIPDDDELIALWDRVEQRRYQIEHCEDITGAKRMPDLFGPPIDPRLLMKIKAEGLTLDQVLNVTSGSLPPHRFPVLLGKAREYLGVVQNLGSALLSALEKRDNEALNKLRTVHEQHLLKMRVPVLNFELQNAQQTLTALQLQRDAAQYRHDYYMGLSQAGLNAWEQAQQAASQRGHVLLEVAGTIDIIASVLSLLPQFGAPTADKWGGLELGNAARSISGALRIQADQENFFAQSAGTQSAFQRRDDEWRYQAALARREVNQLARQITAADLRVQIAQGNLDAHNTQISQTEEIFQFYQDRFSNLGFYNLLARSVQRLYRSAFNSAYAMAQLADQAYRFARLDDAEPHLTAAYWNADTGGLLAGELLLLDLQSLERAYLESDQRPNEIEQSFSLAQFAPDALLRLRETGECYFDLPEFFFDLFYPGHYRRRIKAVRITLPCVVGPYTNASATLRLLNSTIRMNPDDAKPVPAPSPHQVAIAASSGQNDAGLFEFSFRDELHLPCEGGGAISSWRLSLPRSFQMFNYETITDAVLRISYTALSDEGLRDLVEGRQADLSRAVATKLAGQQLQCVIGLRQDLPAVFAKLNSTVVGTDLQFDTGPRLPWFVNNRTITISWLRVVLRTPPPVPHRPPSSCSTARPRRTSRPTIVAWSLGRPPPAVLWSRQTIRCSPLQTFPAP